MSATQKSVLIVDDSPDDARFLMENLKNSYALMVATSGAKAIDMADRETPPDVILLDVSMPEMDGYETCQALKGNPRTESIDVIFVTAHDSLDEKLKGYEVGASDYLIKPIVPDELKRKVNVLIENAAQRSKRSMEAKQAREVAMTAMQDAGEQAVIMDFMRSSFSVKTIEELLTQIVSSLSRYDLISSVQIRTPWGNLNGGVNEPIPPLESELMYQLKDSGRLQGLGKRLIINCESITILVKNMPDDEFKSGRLRDHLAHIIEGAYARYRALVVEQNLDLLIVDSMQALEDIQNLLGQQKAKFVDIMDKVKEEVQASFLSYGLTEDQEQLLIDIVDNAEQESLTHFEEGLVVDQRFSMIIDRLKSFTK